MASVSVTVDDGELNRALDRLMRQVNHWRPAFNTIGEPLLRSTCPRFDAQESPADIPWIERFMLSDSC